MPTRTDIDATAPAPFSRQTSLRQRILITLGRVASVISIVVSLAVGIFLYNSDNASWQSRRLDAAASLAVQVSAFLGTQQDTLELLAAIVDEQVVEQLAQDLTQPGGAFFEIILLDTTGNILVNEAQSEAILANRFTLPQSNWFQSAAEGNRYIGSVEIESTGRPYVIIALPAAGNKIVATRLFMQALYDVVAGAQIGSTGTAFVVSRAGVVEAHGNPDVVTGRSLMSDRPEFAALLANTSLPVSETYTNFAGVPVIANAMPIADTDWIVVAEVARSEVNTNLRRAVIIFGVGLIVSRLLAWFVLTPILNRVLFTRINALEEGSRQIGAGNFDHRVAIEHRDELGQVAATFNQMAVQLDFRTQQLEIARAEAETANRLKSQFLASVTHELRTPLGAIVGYAQLIGAGAFGSVTAKQRDIAGKLASSGQHLADIVSSLLDQAQLESGVFELSLGTVNLPELVEELRFEHEIRALELGVNLKTMIDRDMPPVIHTDKTRLRQIINNLIQNGLKYTPQGGAVSLCVFKPDAQTWSFHVTDNGTGIPDELHASIFEPFRQVDRAMAKAVGGIGLGLSIVKQLVEIMGGAITINSKPGTGSTFTVTLPLVLKESQHAR